MKSTVTIIFAVGSFSLFGCVKEQYINHPYGEGNGNITFYTDASILLNEYPITIQVDQQTIGTINRNYLNFATDHPNATEPF